MLCRVWYASPSSTSSPYGIFAHELLTVLSRVATGITFKQAKGDLTKRGWNPDTDWDGDTLYWLNMDPKNGKAARPRYEKLDKGPWVEIESGRAKL
jgi:hypothetical protein